MSKTPQGSYPRQAQSYPGQQVYPTQSYPQQQQQQQQQYPTGYLPSQQPQVAYYGAVPGQTYGIPPPPYTETTQQGQATMAGSAHAASAGLYNPGVVPAPYGMAHGTHYLQQYPGQVGPAGMLQGSFDPGARFGAGATHNIPPPPPGYVPNAAQMASAQGQHVVVQQRQAGWFGGGTNGGYTTW